MQSDKAKYVAGSITGNMVDTCNQFAVQTGNMAVLADRERM